MEKGQTGWEPAYAEQILTTGKGSRFSFATTYFLLTQQLGLPSYTVIGGLGKNADPHGRVEIELDGTVHMFDTQLGWRYLHDYGKEGHDFFKILPSEPLLPYTW